MSHKYVLSPSSFLHSIRTLLLHIPFEITHKAPFKMSFHPSNVHLIEVENNRDLVATLKDEQLGLRIDRIDLNKYLGYYDGAFKWDRKGFSEYCESLSFRWEGEVPTLHAVMRKRESDLRDSARAPWDRDPWDMISVNLAERITIKNGGFEVQSVPSDWPFNIDAIEISLKDKHILHAVLKDDEGNKRSSTLDLDEHLGNEEGYFKWGGKGFSKSAENARIFIHGGLPFLAAGLVNPANRWRPYDTKVNLAERIKNNNGQLEVRYD
ncbi:Cyanovirin-N [Penicillium canescens]|uniref:Cyanovirin-N n=1 Tax=Penicillium canescens TaxID=5083 RepID=A0AAD6N4S5_PENCN|nr:Cyanovirin-N [Penicillium canescens]KAJ6012819.1 Cyanovirin-N [Penicillium canescens]KAJ6030162.1 Cyanovirin-N [Penicillium canescens]KAJ6060539.1 Cyanovirin-N [Penicillium canescens]KAJ6063899.1 Cyanovirin-N [Penicillium canescens]KAJ6077840.1 Cyanovirin-N [Penicillium canescens]